MKRFQTICLAFCMAAAIFAENADLKRAAELYAAQSYEEAAQAYAALIETGSVSPELYYNYANACYKSNRIGLAILNYERALALRPDYEDAKFNLEFVNQQKVDKIEPIEPFFITAWVDALGHALSSNAWAAVSIALFVVCLSAVLVYVFGKRRWIRKTGFFVALFALAFSLCAMLYGFSSKNRLEQRADAIVMVGAVTVKSAPDDSGTELFVLHEGTKVTIKSLFSDSWVEIRIADGNVGWIKASAIERI